MSAVANGFARPYCSESEHPLPHPLPVPEQASTLRRQGESAPGLPERIAQAIARLLTGTQDWALDLGCAQRSLLARIVGLADRTQPQMPIHVRRTTLARWIGASVATVQRLLLSLQELGWIERDQVKSRRRGFQVGEIRLTRCALDRLFPPTEHRSQTGGRASNGSAQPRRSSASDALLNTSQCLHRQPDAGLLESISTPLETATQGNVPSKKRFAPRLPSGLVWLQSVGITAAGICALMRKATASGHRLEDVACAAKKSLTLAKNPFAYLHALVTQPRDWAASAARSLQQDENQRQSEAQSAAAKRAWDWIDDLNGTSLRRADGSRRYTLMGRVALLSEAGQSKGAIPLTVEMAEKLRADWEAGRLVFEGIASCSA